MNEKRDRIINQPMPGHVKPGDRLRASTINGIIDTVGYRTIKDGLLQFRGGGEATPEDESKWIFGMISTSTTCTIYSGDIFFKGAWRSSAQTVVTLSMNPSYIYASLNRTSYAVTIKEASSQPAPSSSEFNLLLAKFTPSAGVYSLTKRYWRGAYVAEAPTL